MMGKKKKPTTPVDKIDAATWKKIGAFLSDTVHDMEVDNEMIGEEQGDDYMPALRGLAAYLSKGGTLKEVDR
jgi:hypothetical protein